MSVSDRRVGAAPPRAQRGDLSGYCLGGYRILRKLGQGGMATVYKAHEESLNRVVALKVIGQHLSDQPPFVERFRREAQAAAALTHPNIVQIYSIGEDGGVIFFAMEYVEGQTLSEMIERSGFLAAPQLVPIITQTAQALGAAHEAHIVHRDIKPSNILIDMAGRVRVADFGVAQVLTGARLTQSGAVVGTPEYVSPEQCHGETVDSRADVYALGVTFYQALTGRVPFQADSAAALVMRIVRGQAPRIEELNPLVPDAVRDVVTRMMATDREQRFQSVGDLLVALSALDTRSSPAPRPAPPTTTPGRASPAGLAVTPSSVEAGSPPGGPTSGGWRSLGPGLSLAVLAVAVAGLTWTLLSVRLPIPRPPTDIPVSTAPPVADRAPTLPRVPPHPPRVGATTPRRMPPGSVTGPPASNRLAVPPVPPRHPPAPDTVSVVVSGDREIADLTERWVQRALGDARFALVDEPPSLATRGAGSARIEIDVGARIIGTRELDYFGRRQTLYTLSLTMHAIDGTDGSTMAGPVRSNIDYTSTTLQPRVQGGVERLVRRLARAIRDRRDE